jgi:hypothetical protein
MIFMKKYWKEISDACIKQWVVCEFREAIVIDYAVNSRRSKLNPRFPTVVQVYPRADGPAIYTRGNKSISEV